MGAWLERTGVERVAALAIDGKALRGIHGDEVTGVHLVAAYAHEAGTVLGQVAAPGKGHELAAAAALLDVVPLAGRVVTADALLTQRARCEQIVGRAGDYVLPVDANQPTLLAEMEEAFSPMARRKARRGRRPDHPALECRQVGGPHGRREERILWAIHHPGVLRWLGSTGTHRTPWPHARQLCRLERRRTPLRRGVPTGPTSAEVVYCITSLPPERADAARLLTLICGHWGIENRLHHVRDVTFDEDRSAVRWGAAPQVMAATRNLVLALLRRQRHANIAAALRTYASRPPSAIALVANAHRFMLK